MKHINKKLAALFLVLVVAVGATACGSTIGDMDIAKGESAVYIQEDGKVSYGVAEKFDKDYYDESKLEDTINKEVADYNDGKKASVKNAITVDTFKVKSDVATLVLEFATTYDFSTYIKEYNKVESNEFFMGKIADNSDCKIKGDFTSPDKKKDATTKEIKAMDPGAKVVMCSAMGQEAMVVEAIKLGALDFIVKPFKAERILQTVKKILD